MEQAITRAYIDPDLYLRMAPLGHTELFLNLMNQLDDKFPYALAKLWFVR